MLRWLLQALFGKCPCCAEKDTRIEGLERRLSDALDRVMSRDYAHLAFVKTQAPPADEDKRLITDNNLHTFGDGLS